MKILVTGGTGFAGSHLIEELSAQGFKDIVATCFSKPAENSRILPESQYEKIDLSDPRATSALVRSLQPDWIFHLASFAYVGKSFRNARELFANNFAVQLNMLEAIRDFSPDSKMLSIGSAEEYGLIPDDLSMINEQVLLNPVNPYAVSKVAQDMLALSFFHSHRLAIVRARPFNHIGTRQSSDFAVPAFAKQIAAVLRGEQEQVRVGKLTAIRDFTSVRDVVRAYVLLMQRGTLGEVYNIGSGRGVSMQWVLDTMIASTGRTITIEMDPGKLRPLDAPGLIADNRKIGQLGWMPTEPIEAELKRVLHEWMEK